MKELLMSVVSRRVFYPLSDVRERQERLGELARLRASQWVPEALRRRRQWARLQETLRYAYEHCPYYRRRGAHRVVRSDDIGSIPVLTKDEVRRHRDALISDEFRASDLINAKTGGSTGTALSVLFDRRCQALRNAAAFRSDEWAGWKLGEAKGALWGNPPSPRTWKESLRATWLDRLVYLDTVHMTDDDMDRFVDELVARGIRVLYGHSHSLYVLARRLKATGDRQLRPTAIISTSMMLLPGERRLIEAVFGCPVSDRYGCEEVGLIASECERHHGLHLNTDHLFIEFLKADGSPAAPGEEGRVVVTDLINRGMPLIRYEVGDWAVPTERACGCGRALPLVERIVGRTADFLVGPGGALVAGVSLVERTLTAIPGLAQMQIVQDAADRLTVNIVPDDVFSEDSERRLKSEIASVFGSIEIDVRRFQRLPQETNGKYRFSICRLPSVYQEAAR